MRTIVKTVLIISAAFLSTFIIVEFSPLEFTDVALKTIFYQYTLVGIPIYGFLLGVYMTRKKIWNLFTGIRLGLIGFFILNSIVFSFPFWHGHSIWETKEIIAVHKKHRETIIVEQWIDTVAFGYYRRIFKTTPITSFLSWKIDYNGKILDDIWEIKVDRKLEIGY